MSEHVDEHGIRLRRDQLSLLLNRLYDRGDERFSVEHPADELDELVEVELGPHDDCTLRFRTDADDYRSALDAVRREHSSHVADDLPDPGDYVGAVLASGAIDLPNREDVEAFLERYGDPDLTAGHRPVYAGFDTNVLPWRIDRVLGLRERDAGLGYVNGFALASGVRDELDWDDKCDDTSPFEAAFGDQFATYWNQPLGAVRKGRLGLQSYRELRDVEQAVEVNSGRGDEAIVEAYDEYDDDHRADVVLFSNDRTFVERAQAHTILAQWVELPRSLPRKTDATWAQVETLLYVLTVLFGVLEVPGVTMQGVWPGKDGRAWQEERLQLDVRSTTLEPQLERDLEIVESYEELRIE